jgi:rhodanese-related sulfurtransferase
VETIGSVKPKKLNDADMPIMVYCQSGARSSQAARRLSALGYTQIYDLGGIHRWTYGTVR